MEIKISPRVQEKLRTKHGEITQQEIAECFANRWGKFYADTRYDHQTNPPTFWFVSMTDKGRTLKVIFVRYQDFFAIKSAYEPNDGSDALYERLCRGE